MNSDTVQIEPYRPEDRPWLVLLVALIQEHERREEPDLKPGDEIAEGYADALIARASDPDGVLLVARNDGEPIGFIAGRVETDDDPLLGDHARAHGYVSDICVADGWRRRGIARRLMMACEWALRARGCCRMRVTAKATNPDALGCYRALGYRPYEIIFAKDL